MRAELRGAILFSGNAALLAGQEAAINNYCASFEKDAAAYSPFIVNPEAKKLFDEAMDAYEKTFKPSILKIVEGAKKGVPVAELTAMMADCAKPGGDLIGQNLKKTMTLKADLLDKASTDAASAYKFSLSVIAVVVFAGAAVSVFLGVYISKIISRPLNAAVGMIKEMGQGNLSMRLNVEREDEIGVMAKTMDKFASDLQTSVLGVMKQIASGDLSAKVAAHSDKDEIADTLNKTMDSLRLVVGTMKEISEGDLSAKIELKNDRDEVSRALKNTVASLNAVVGTMKKISEGDLSSSVEPRSGKDVISAALKTTVESLRELIIEDGGRVLQAAADKDLSQRLTGSYKGEFARMKDNINTVMQSLDAALVQVTDAVSQVASASGEISNGAQSLAEGSNEQASSLEEVSSSLEEMSSMTKQNADNSSQAMILASEASAAAKEGDVTIRRMANAINQIKQSSDNTAKIVKSIDDIAFQTNLLALNAAVEAARAGEAGKGFAVVAEEVRNLAMRSADAAKSTADMIEESVKNADNGVKITEEVAVSLGQIVNRTGKVGDLIAEIAAASKEQASGIEQVNMAVAQMNGVTQQNASNSEESASAAEELNNQAAELAAMVGSFKLTGSADRNTAALTVNAPAQTPSRRQQYAGHNNARADRQKHLSHQTQIKSVRAVQAKELIPLDEEELAKIF
jgi:methyl-accepting chemotaxis protein